MIISPDLTKVNKINADKLESTQRNQLMIDNHNQEGLGMMTSINKFCQKQRGLILTEALVSLGLLGFGMLAFTKLQVTFFEGNSLAQQRVEATTFAQEKIEELRYLEDMKVPISSQQEALSGGNATYTRSWTIVDYTVPKYKSISVTVSWPTKTGEIQSINLTTVITSGEPALSGKLISQPVSIFPNMSQ